MESYKDDSAELLDTRTRLEEVNRERTKIFSELTEMQDCELSDLWSRLGVFTSSGSESTEDEARLELVALTSKLAVAQ